MAIRSAFHIQGNVLHVGSIQLTAISCSPQSHPKHRDGPNTVCVSNSAWDWGPWGGQLGGCSLAECCFTATFTCPRPSVCFLELQQVASLTLGHQECKGFVCWQRKDVFIFFTCCSEKFFQHLAALWHHACISEYCLLALSSSRSTGCVALGQLLTSVTLAWIWDAAANWCGSTSNLHIQQVFSVVKGVTISASTTAEQKQHLRDRDPLQSGQSAPGTPTLVPLSPGWARN